MPRRRVWNAAARGCGGTLKPLNRIPILCTASILYLFIVGRNLSTKQTLAAAHHAGRGGMDRCRYGMPSGYNARDPFSGPCWRCTYLPVLTLGMQCHLCCQTGIKQKRESAPLVRAVEGRPQGNPTPGRRRALSLSKWNYAAFRWASEGRYRPYPPSDQRVFHRRRWWPSHAVMLYCR